VVDDTPAGLSMLALVAQPMWRQVVSPADMEDLWLHISVGGGDPSAGSSEVLACRDAALHWSSRPACHTTAVDAADFVSPTFATCIFH